LIFTIKAQGSHGFATATAWDDPFFEPMGSGQVTSTDGQNPLSGKLVLVRPIV
jgi:hypothetical protein